MTIKHLQIFSEVCRHGSITRAAEVLNVAQPAVSMAVRELENFYGVRMFERMNRRLYITEAGERLRLYADSILDRLNEAQVTLKDINTISKIRFGVNVSFGTQMLPRLLSGFAKEYPMIPVYTGVKNSRQIEEQILNNELDFGIIDKPLHTQLLVSDLLAEDGMVAVCAAGYPLPDEIEIKELEQVPFLTREQGSGNRYVIDHLGTNYDIKVNVLVESVSIQCLIGLCIEGLGLLFLPKRVAESYLASGQLKEIRIRNFSYVRQYYLVYHKSKYLTKSMKSFKEYLGGLFSDVT
ncbi:MAG: LysR family transcriptional regulator [Lachnospiraceae bacterium]|jgi:DNA-binding transcriptional LysR family regulator|nr:LysR family transcriptional regulator [Lachnospiraceae bacterium]